MGALPSSHAATTTTTTTASTVGQVTLPYATYQSTHNETYNFFKYSNIRFADPPNGTLRFKNPVAPSKNETTIQDGSYGQTCYQLLQGTNSGAANQGEDCLFLDVIVPDSIPEGTTLPVLFYIYGGGWYTGQKEIYDGSDLVVTSNNSMIYVIPNYRLGAFGWLGAFGDNMPGLADQLFAMEWVEKYIHLFGGDADRVTVAGHSAGAGSLEAHLISNGGEGSLPMDKAVIMSPAFSPLTKEVITERNAAGLEYFGWESYIVEEILSLTADDINDLTGHITGTGGSWGPFVDGDYILEMPGNAFSSGRYHSELSAVITGSLADEAHDFVPTTSPYIINDSSDVRNMSYDTKELMTSFFSEMGFNLSAEVIDEAWDIYPAINNTDLYYTIFGKYDRILAESLIDCHTIWIGQSYNTSYGWYFDLPPAYHAQENPYLFAGGTGTGGSSSLAINATLSGYMKDWLVGFTMGDVNWKSGEGVPVWEVTGDDVANIELNDEGVGMISDPLGKKTRCAFWETNIA